MRALASIAGILALGIAGSASADSGQSNLAKALFSKTTSSWFGDNSFFDKGRRGSEGRNGFGRSGQDDDRGKGRGRAHQGHDRGKGHSPGHGGGHCKGHVDDFCPVSP